MRRRKNFSAFCLGSLLLLTASPSYGQIDETNLLASGSETFGSDYFSQFAPVTAFDMIVRIPGFNLSGANFGRGLGQGGANVLINGDRLTGKTDVDDQLSRISAANVVRIEIADGAALDIPGLSGQVANIITKSSGLSGTFEWSPEFRPRISPNWFRGNATLSGEKGNLTYTIGIKNEAFRQGNYGLETLIDADGVLFETRDEIRRRSADRPGASVDLTWKPKTDHTGNLNFEINEFDFQGVERSIRTARTDVGSDLFVDFTDFEDEWNMSIGADYEFPVSLGNTNGKLKTIGYYRFEGSPTLSVFEAFEDEQLVEASRFQRQADEAETILRSEYSWFPQEGRDWQLAVEGVFNYLETDASLSELENGTLVDVELDGASIRIEEKRAETTLTHSRELTDKLDIQTSIGVEYSELTTTGSNALIRDYVRPKGFLSATYNIDENKLWRAKLEREVGQLNFFDFLASADLNNDETRDANNNLVPPQSWVAELAYERSFGQGNQWNIVLDGSIIDDLVDRIPIGETGNGVGNIDSTAYTYALHSDLTLKGEDWDMNGVEVNLDFGLHFSHVDDPVEGFNRRLSGDSLWHWSANMRHDIPQTDFAYGVELSQQRNARQFRVETTQLYVFRGPFLGVFVEHKNVFGMRLNLQLNNLLKSSDDFERQIFTNRRDIGVLDFTESREREFGVLARAQLSGTF
jgi:hypothetical protein